LKSYYDYSFEKFGIWEELGELARVSAGSPFWCSDSAVKLSALAGSLEKPFRLFICRYWHRELKSFIERKNFICRFGKRGHFFFGTSGEFGRFLELGASSFSLLRVVSCS
jgi:hypothetical protein